MHLISELKRRSVFRVAAAYVVLSWLIIQIASILYPAFDFPYWSIRIMIIVLSIGFPVAVILAWIYELTPQGVKRSDEIPEDYQGSAAASRTLNIAIIGVLTTAVLLFALDKFWWHSGNLLPGSTGYSDKSIAVLPFVHRSSLDQDRFFAEGIHDDLLTRLAKIDSLRVTSRTSVMQYRNTDKTIPEIGNELGVATLLEGGLQRSGKQIRINAQLINTETDEHIWAETFDRELTAVNLFEIQSEITQAITAALQAKLSPLEQRQVANIPTESLAAYEFYLRGRQSMSSRNEAAFREALDEFGKAVQIDPRFASAWAGMCEVRLSWYHLTSDTEHFESAETACNHAIDLDRDMIDVRVALGTLYRFSGDYARAGEELRLALETDPDNVDALIETGFIYSAQGRVSEAEVSLLKAVELKPHYRAAHEMLFIFYRNHSDKPDRFKLAVSHALKAVELAPGNASAYNNLGTAYHSLQQFDAAKIAWDRALELEPTRTGYTNRGLAYYYEGFFESAAEMQKKAIELAPSDHRAWGRLAESTRYMGGSAERVAEAYDTAVELAEEMLLINSQDWQTLGLLATYLMHSDRADEAALMVDRVLTLSNRKPEALYYAALVAQASGESERALEMIAEALAGNEAYRYYFANEPEFESLRSSERFQTVVGPG